MTRCTGNGDRSCPFSMTANIPTAKAANPTSRPNVPTPGSTSAFSSGIANTNRTSSANAVVVSSRPPFGVATGLAAFLRGTCCRGCLAENMGKVTYSCYGVCEVTKTDVGPIRGSDATLAALGVRCRWVLHVGGLAVSVAIAVTIAVAVGAAGRLTRIPTVEHGAQDSRAIFRQPLRRNQCGFAHGVACANHQ